MKDTLRLVKHIGRLVVVATDVDDVHSDLHLGGQILDRLLLGFQLGLEVFDGEFHSLTAGYCLLDCRSVDTLGICLLGESVDVFLFGGQHGCVGLGVGWVGEIIGLSCWLG